MLSKVYLCRTKKYDNSFYSKGLRLLYETDLAYKYHKLQPEIVQGYKEVIEILEATESLLQIRKMKSLNCENLEGNKKGIKSVRINKIYRIEFIYEEVGKVIYITNISKHYKEINIKYNKNEEES